MTHGDLAEPEARLRRRTFDIGDAEGGRLSAIEFGPAEGSLDLIFLHANGFNGRTYRTILEPLASERRILAVDQRGHGRTTLPAEPRSGRRSWDDLAADLVAILDRLDGPPVTLAGHSMGGTASVLAAVQRPDRVRRLVLFDPVILPWPVTMALRFGIPARRFKDLRSLAEGALRRKASFPSREAALAAYTGRGAFRTWRPEQLADYVADGFRVAPAGGVELACAPAWEASNFLSHAHDVWGALRKLRCPVRIIRAEKGSTCAVTRPLASGMMVETVPGTTHFLPMERPERVRAALLGQ
ncbi:alpha/beta fold hydrolase [Enterovirga aerilata]|uniref:Alpha/beta hydrolase n=1 Tax=Enterovirga aerilata TaxID=2730920 RepID=A0A849I5E8_9HYPH|nr:alpha/beta hydrolase [Enterovirga sp. DB1703]NNM72924.1 alpha/beta hydrolase [Enterovirga sp. DB1703]